MAQGKTPISNLYEYCTKRNSKPKFIDLLADDSEIPTYFKSAEKKFWVKCIAVGKSTIEGGPTKKAAQHAAAQLILRKFYNGSDDDEDDDDEKEEGQISSSSNEDYVTKLLDLCVQRNYHKPEFKCIDSYGKSHDPSFVFECRLDSVVGHATANNKNQSKQMAAKEVYDSLMPSYPDIEKKVALVNEQNLVRDETRQKITTYLKLRELGKVDKMGTTIADRSMFFINHINEHFVNCLRQILKKDYASIADKYEDLVKELNTMYECRVGDFILPGMKQFECLVDFDQFEILIAANNEMELKKEVVEYFSTMLDVNGQLDQWI